MSRIDPDGIGEAGPMVRSRPVWSDLAVIFGFVLGLAVTLARGVVVPANYNFDSQKIQAIALGAIPSFGDDSFKNVALVYRFLHLSNASTAVALCGYLLGSAVIVLSIWRSGNRAETGFRESLLILISFVLVAIYLSQYSKDVFVLPIVAAVLLLPSRLWGDVAIVAIVALYAVYFRQYWLLVGVGFILYRATTRRPVRVRLLILWGVLGAIGVGVSLALILGLPVDHFRSVVNETRSVGAMSQIEPFLTSGSVIAGYVNVILTYFALIVPLPLLTTAGFSYLPIVALFAFIWLSTLFALKRQGAWVNVDHRRGTTLSRAISVIFSFLLTQALFEPDYGSALKHLTPLIPLILFVCLLLSKHVSPRARGVSSAGSQRG